MKSYSIHYLYTTIYCYVICILYIIYTQYVYVKMFTQHIFAVKLLYVKFKYMCST